MFLLRPTRFRCRTFYNVYKKVPEQFESDASCLLMALELLQNLIMGTKVIEKKCNWQIFSPNIKGLELELIEISGRTSLKIML